jgi:LPXTG-site transpeptidase (sortase) family protein
MELARARRAAVASARPVPAVDEYRPASQSLPRLAEPEKLRFAGAAFIVVGALLIGFALQFAGVSQVSYTRDQQLALADFRYQLANATAPVGQTGQDGKLLVPGTPVAVLDVPSIGLSDVVFEGTTSDVTTSGPGHRRDTPLPGQEGASVIYGRQAAYGAPFASISQLAIGDEITATTGQGAATYTVTGVRYTGDAVPAGLATGEGRLTLVSGSGLPFLPQSIVRVDALLTSDVQQTPERVLTYAALDESELTMAGSSSAWPLLVIALMLLGGMIAIFTLSRRFWGKWQTWIVAVPVLIALGLFAAHQVTLVLPNVM